MDTLSIGLLGEQQACQFLEARGLKLLARNYRCLFGEIDLVMRDKEEVVFVEVRKRKTNRFGSPIESITLAKQRKIIKTALQYLQKMYCFGDIQYRFDVVGITGEEIEWIKDAFTG
jgi:putative endonuclease